MKSILMISYNSFPVKKHNTAEYCVFLWIHDLLTVASNLDLVKLKNDV